MVEFYSRGHGKNIVAEIEYEGEMNLVVVYEGVRYSIQSSQIIKRINKLGE